jgi:opacity protein-like surface antigen
MRTPSAIRRARVHVLTALIVAGAARQADAQGFISPFLGYNFGGDAGCPEITDCEDKHANYGIAFGALGGVVGFEGEFAHTSDFFGDSPREAVTVLTMTGNFMLAPRFGPVQPYGLAGIGLIRTSVESGGQDEDENQIGWDAGGGLLAFFSAHIGARADVRYFHAFQLLDFSRFPNLPIRETKLDFGRFSVAAVFKF